jgi:hypothetical protein
MLLAGIHGDGESIPWRWKRAGCEGGETAGWVERSIEIDPSSSVRIRLFDDEESTASVGRDPRSGICEGHEEALAPRVGQKRVLDAVDLESKCARNLVGLDEFRHEGYVDGRAVLGRLEGCVNSSVRIERILLDAGEFLERGGVPIADSECRPFLTMDMGDMETADP